MNNKLHVVMPMGGAGSRFFRNGFVMPKPLIEINGKPFLYWATKSLTKYLDNYDLTFVVLESHISEFSIDKIIQQYFSEAQIVAVTSEEVHSGPIMTCLAGIKNLHDDVPIIFNDCDHMFRCSDFHSAMNAGNVHADGALLTFHSNEPQFSYIQYDDDGAICGTVEKKVVSDQAICGAYYVRNADVFRKTAAQYLNECAYAEFFVSGVYNVMCQHDMSVKHYEVDFHVPFGTPVEYEAARNSAHFSEFL